MPSFITRIELQSASPKDYQKLEEEMIKASFKDVKKASSRNQPKAAPAEYNCNGNYTLLEVTDAALKAARKTGRNYSFTIIKEKKLSMHG
jgi:predicted enzyme involved in methoxymalonyl-ACP biosynthesis